MDKIYAGELVDRKHLTQNRIKSQLGSYHNHHSNNLAHKGQLSARKRDSVTNIYQENQKSARSSQKLSINVKPQQIGVKLPQTFIR